MTFNLADVLATLQTQTENTVVDDDTARINPAWEPYLSKDEGTYQHVAYAEFVAEAIAGRFLFSPELGWLKWSGKVWDAQADDAPVRQAMTEAARLLYRAYGQTNNSWMLSAANVLQRGNHRGYIARELQTLDTVRVDAHEFDAHKHLLTFRNGTVDLRTGDLREHDAADKLTQMTNVNYNPDAEAPRFDQFLREAHPEDNGVRDYLRVLMGYGITGENREHCFGVFFGDKGRNGKGTLLRAMKEAFGPKLVLDAEFSVFEKGSGTHTEAVARLKNARIVTASEGSEGVPMDAELLKRHAGGDAIQTRQLYRSAFEYVPQYLIILQSNYLPDFKTSGSALWARVRAVEFGESFIGREDRKLDADLAKEAEGIAAWAVRGAVEYYADGLVSPEAVEATTRTHKDKVNPLQDMLGDLFEFDAEAVTKRSDFNRALKDWRSENGHPAGKFQPSWTKTRLSEQGVTEKTVKGTKVYEGIRLMPDYGGPASVLPHNVTPISRNDADTPAGPPDVFGQTH